MSFLEELHRIKAVSANETTKKRWPDLADADLTEYLEALWDEDDVPRIPKIVGDYNEKLSELSDEEQERRRPPPPDQLVEVDYEMPLPIGRSGAARTRREK